MTANLNLLGATGLPILITEMDIDGPDADQLVTSSASSPRSGRTTTSPALPSGATVKATGETAQQATLVYANGAEKPALRWLKGYLRGTAPVVQGPATVTVASGYAAGTELATFAATAPGGAAYPEGTPVAWSLVPVPGTLADASQAVEFEEGTGDCCSRARRFRPGSTPSGCTQTSTRR